MNQRDKYISDLESEIQYLKRLLDDNVITLHKYRERFAIIDKSLVWYGSMTLLSNEKEDDSLMRISNPAIAEELLEFAVLQS